MTKEHISAVLKYYDELLSSDGVVAICNNHATTHDDRLAHVHWMCQKAQEYCEQGELDKANRWLGFIQGVFSCEDLMSIEEMRNHNRDIENIPLDEEATAEMIHRLAEYVFHEYMNDLPQGTWVDAFPPRLAGDAERIAQRRSWYTERVAQHKRDRDGLK